MSSKPSDSTHIPSVVPQLLSRGFGEFLDKTLQQIVVDNKDDIHEIVDRILANHDRASSKGRGLKSSAGGNSSSAPPYIFKDPKISPSSVDLRRSSVLYPNTRSVIEPIHERLNSSTTFIAPFEAALEDCKKVVAEIVAACRKENKKFFDSSFAFDLRSTMYPDGSPDDCTVKEPQYVARLQDLFPNCVLFEGRAQCDDLKQGEVGDCFLIGALSATAANDPVMIERVFAAYDIACGVYGVVFYKSGGWEWVIVDDLIAVKRERSGAMYPQYVTPKGKEIWPAVLEKAYAKVHFNWDTIDGGFSREATVDITGGVDKMLDLYRQDKSVTFKQLMAVVCDPMSIVGCSVGAHVEAGDETGSSGEEGAVFGLFHGHAYGVVDAKITSDGTGFLKLRNPWGEQEWKGPYSDGSNEWKQYPQHKAEINPSFGDDGEFWMKWEDFRKYMTNVDVVYAVPPTHKVLTLYMKAAQDFVPATTVMLMVYDAATKFTIVGEQDDPKVKFNSQQHKRQKSDPYIALKLQVRKLRKVPTSYEELPGCFEVKLFDACQRSRSVCTELTLEPGVYVVGLMSAGPLPAGDVGTFVRIIGPHDADYCAWVYAQGEGSRLDVGKCPPLKSLAMPDVPAMKPLTPRPAASVAAVQAPQQPLPQQPAPNPVPAVAAAANSANAARVLGLQQELDEAKSYTAHLQGLLKKYQEQVDGLNAKMLALQQKAAEGSAAGPRRMDPAAQSLEAWQRVALSERDYSDVVRVTFDTIAEGRPTLDVEEATNAVRVLVTSGFGLDEVLSQHKMLSGRKGLTAADFQVLCSDVVKKWSVYQK
jgi:hypothetical protein